MPFDSMPEQETVKRDARFVPKALYIYEPPAKPASWTDYREGDCDVIKLRKCAAGLLTVGASWCRWTDAEDAYGRRMSPSSNHAVRTCVRGALYRAERIYGFPEGTARKAELPFLAAVNQIFGRVAALHYLEWSVR